MKTVLFGLYSISGNGAFLGHQLTKEYVKAGNDLQSVACTEYTLTDTGFAENSYQFVALGEDEQYIAAFVEEIGLQFNSIVEKSFGEPFDAIDFDDKNLQDELKELLQYIKTKGQVTRFGENRYGISIVE